VSKLNYFSTLFIIISLVGCAATADKKSADESPEQAQQQTPTKATKPVEQAIKPPLPAESNNQIAEPDAISRIQAQLTALQEQVIKLSADTSAILQLSQVAVANAQIDQSINTRPDANNRQSQPTNSDSLSDILKKLEDISPSPEASFGIVSSYTASKQWVLIRFDRYTGETWLADNSGWNALNEVDSLQISQYDVHLIRADQDKKGFVASRIDQRTGDTWWLNKNQWVVYQ